MLGSLSTAERERLLPADEGLTLLGLLARSQPLNAAKLLAGTPGRIQALCMALLRLPELGGSRQHLAALLLAAPELFTARAWRGSVDTAASLRVLTHDLGLGLEAALQLVKRCPKLLELGAERLGENAAGLLALCRRAGVEAAPAARCAVQRSPRLLLVPAGVLARNVAALAGVGQLGGGSGSSELAEVPGGLEAARPLATPELKERAEALSAGLGLDVAGMQRLLTRPPTFLATPDLAARMERLAGTLALSAAGVQRLVLRHPALVAVPADQLAASVEALCLLGFQRSELARMVQRSARLLQARPQQIAESAARLARLLPRQLAGRELLETLRSCPRLLTAAPATVEDSLAQLHQLMGGNPAAVAHVVKRCPRLLLFGAALGERAERLTAQLELSPTELRRLLLACAELLALTAEHIEACGAVHREAGMVGEAAVQAAENYPRLYFLRLEALGEWIEKWVAEQQEQQGAWAAACAGEQQHGSGSGGSRSVRSSANGSQRPAKGAAAAPGGGEAAEQQQQPSVPVPGRSVGGAGLSAGRRARAEAQLQQLGCTAEEARRLLEANPLLGSSDWQSPANAAKLAWARQELGWAPAEALAQRGFLRAGLPRMAARLAFVREQLGRHDPPPSLHVLAGMSQAQFCQWAARQGAPGAANAEEFERWVGGWLAAAGQAWDVRGRPAPGAQRSVSREG